MDGMYGLHTPSEAVDYAIDRGPAAALVFPPVNLMADYQAVINQTASFRNLHYHNHSHSYQNRFPVHGSDELISVASAISEADPIANREIHRGEDVLTAIKAKIASHPRYPCLLQAYIDCQKVGAPPEIACLLDEIRRENGKDNVVSSRLRADPGLDEFMETYCDILIKYKSDLSRSFDEATDFLSKIETQLSDLYKGVFARSPSDDGVISSDEEGSGGEVDILELQPKDEERELKDRLFHRFGSHIGSLKMEFSKKKKKKGKLPREARQTLLEWWNTHYKWPYPTEADKIALAETTGLDPRQINNWFINQRKRHWKPPENMHFALMDNLSSGHFFTDD